MYFLEEKEKELKTEKFKDIQFLQIGNKKKNKEDVHKEAKKKKLCYLDYEEEEDNELGQQDTFGKSKLFLQKSRLGNLTELEKL